MIRDMMQMLTRNRPQTSRKSRRFVPGLGLTGLETRLAPSGFGGDMGGYPDTTITVTNQDQGGQPPITVGGDNNLRDPIA